jgi:outer membrane lipoprotein-sorting protein
MKNIFFSFLSLVVIVPRLAAQDAEALLEKVKAKLEKVNDYKADGRMKMDVSFIDAPPSKVTVYYKKPNKFKVKKDGGISILPKGGVSINLGTLISNQQYDIVPKKDSVLGGVTTKVVKLLPVDESSEVVLTTLFIEEKYSVVRKAVVTTRESGTYEIDLTYGKFTDWGLPDKVVFSFNTKDYKLPKGITFEYEKGTRKKEESLKNKKGKVEISYSNYTINKGVDDKIFETNQ